jgi:hypothetical protein
MTKRSDIQPNRRLAAVLVAGAALLFFWLLAAPSARAGFEAVECFAGTGPEPCKPVAEEKFGEEVQLGGVGGMAVNYTGAGGVKAGTVYAASVVGGGLWIAMFEPKAGGGLEFRERWEVRELEEPYERCGPLLGVDGGGKAEVPCAPRVESGAGIVDVDVDEVSGNVYAFNGGIVTAGRTMIVVYDAKGEEEIDRFGKRAPAGKTTAETPDEIHGSGLPGGIAVNGAGEVYVFDSNNTGNYRRLMKFKPKSPGKFDEYEYAGLGEDVGAASGAQAGRQPSKPVTDAAGHIYVASLETFIEEYDPANPGAGPICSFEFAKGGITALTVNPATGTPFFSSYKLPKRVHQLSACDESSHEFKELGQIEVKPPRDDLWGLAFDPVHKFQSRGTGILYGGAPGPVPTSGVGAGEPGQSSLGYIFAPLEENPPLVEAQSVGKVKATTAQLSAVINPAGNRTRYVFQYLTETAFQEAGESFAGAALAPLPEGAEAGEGKVGIAVGVTLTGLSADTDYRFRVLATSNCSEAEAEKVCEDAGPAQGFHTYPAQAPGPADHRAFELVSPAEKHGGQVYPAYPAISSCGAEVKCKPGPNDARFPMQSAPDGEAVAFEGTAFVPGEGAAFENEYVARRSEAGWVSTNPSPQVLLSGEERGYMAFDAGLKEAVLAQQRPVLTASAPPEYENLYAQTTQAPFPLTPFLSEGLFAEVPPARSGEEFELRFAGASADLSRVFFKANDALTGETPFAPAAVDGGAGKFNLYEWERAGGGLRLVNVAPGNALTAPGAAIAGTGSANAISADGSRAFFANEAGQLFVRENAQSTRAIPGSSPTSGFLAAATDGSRVLLSDGHLYDLQSEVSIDLSAGKGGFQGLVGQSDDLTHVYFVDTAILSGAEENSEGDKAQAGKNNLYAWSEGAIGFVATLAAGDNGGGSLDLPHDWAALPSKRTAEASPSGRYLAFVSDAPLSGYDNVGPCETNHAGGLIPAPCTEAFLFDSGSGTLFCASCNPSGAPPLGYSVLRLIQGPATGTLPQPRYLTDSGRLYFDSQDTLSQLDTNEGVEDVYEFEPTGARECKREAGCLSLISAGSESVDSNLLAVDATGANVFFTSRDRLVAADSDDLLDLYDAREFGGFAFESQLPPSPCQGEGCQPLPPAPAEAPPASSALQDPGNVKPSKGCKKGKVKRKGKCVKKNSPKKAKHNKAKHKQAQPGAPR